MSDAAQNEQTKLLATALNNVAVAFIVIGVVTPMTAASFGVGTALLLSWSTVGFAVIWFCAGVSLHWIGRRVLRSVGP